MVDVNLLKTISDGHTIDSILSELEKEVVTLQASLIILKHTIIIYPSLSEVSKGSLRRIFANSFVCTSQLVGFIKLLGEKAEAKIYKEFLIETLSLEDYMYSSLKKKIRIVEQGILDSMFFGSRIFNVVSDIVGSTDYLQLMSRQVEYWFNDNKDWAEVGIADTFLQLFRFHPIYAANIILEGLIVQNKRNWDVFVGICNAKVDVQHKKLVHCYVLGYLDRISNSDNVHMIYSMLLTLEWKLFNLLELMKFDSIYFKYAFICSLPLEAKVQLLEIMVQKFSISEKGSDRQLCEILVMLANNIPQSKKLLVAHGTGFLNAVTSRLASEDASMREATMLVAKLFVGDDLKYESTYKIWVPTETLLHLPSLDFDVLKPLQTYSTTPNTEVSISSSNLKSTYVDSDDESSDDQTRDIVFLKDLVYELENIDASSYTAVQLFKKTVELVRQKKDFKSEISFYFKALISTITALSNSMSLHNFEESRINAIVSLIVIAPSEVINVHNTLFHADLSLQQRMSILSALALAARELRGFEDDYIQKPKFYFPSKLLPTDIPQQSSSEVEEHPADKSTDIFNAKHTWRSRKLDKIPTSQTSNNNFGKYASSFFFPLAYGWLNGIDLGTFDSLFKNHYLTTLKVIFSAAYPHRDYESMTQLFDLVISNAESQGIKL